jgi:hypothetical protein
MQGGFSEVNKRLDTSNRRLARAEQWQTEHHAAHEFARGLSAGSKEERLRIAGRDKIWFGLFVLAVNLASAWLLHLIL